MMIPPQYPCNHCGCDGNHFHSIPEHRHDARVDEDAIKAAIFRIGDTICETTGMVRGEIITRMEGRISEHDFHLFVSALSKRTTPQQEPSGEVVERVAKWIFCFHMQREEKHWIDLSGFLQGQYRTQAKAAIAAMQEEG